MNCEQAEALLAAHLCSELPDETTAEVQSHLDDCDACRHVALDLRLVMGLLSQGAKADLADDAPRLDAERLEALSKLELSEPARAGLRRPLSRIIPRAARLSGRQALIAAASVMLCIGLGGLLVSQGVGDTNRLVITTDLNGADGQPAPAGDPGSARYVPGFMTRPYTSARNWGDNDDLGPEPSYSFEYSLPPDEETAVPYDRHLVYPDYWEKIVRRIEKGGIKVRPGKAREEAIRDIPLGGKGTVPRKAAASDKRGEAPAGAGAGAWELGLHVNRGDVRFSQRRAEANTPTRIKVMPGLPDGANFNLSSALRRALAKRNKGPLGIVALSDGRSQETQAPAAGEDDAKTPSRPFRPHLGPPASEADLRAAKILRELVAQQGQRHESGERDETKRKELEGLYRANAKILYDMWGVDEKRAFRLKPSPEGEKLASKDYREKIRAIKHDQILSSRWNRNAQKNEAKRRLDDITRRSREANRERTIAAITKRALNFSPQYNPITGTPPNLAGETQKPNVVSPNILPPSVSSGFREAVGHKSGEREPTPKMTPPPARPPASQPRRHIRLEAKRLAASQSESTAGRLYTQRGHKLYRRARKPDKRRREVEGEEVKQPGIRQLLERERTRLSATRAERAAAGRFYAQNGRKLYESFQYERAQAALQKALELDPKSKSAQRYLNLTDELLGLRTAKITTTLEHLRGEKKISAQEQILSLEKNYDKGVQMRKEAFSPEDDDDIDHDELLSRQVQSLTRAIGRFERARQIMKWMPHHVDLSDHERRVNALLAQTRQDRRNKQAELVRRKKALAQKALAQGRAVMRRRRVKSKSRENQTRARLNTHEDKVSEALTQLSQEKHGMVREMLVEVEKSIDKGKKLLGEATGGQEGRRKRKLTLADARKLDEAIVRLDRAREMIKWMPFNIDLSGPRRNIDQMLARAKKARKRAPPQVLAQARSRTAPVRQQLPLKRAPAGGLNYPKAWETIGGGTRAGASDEALKSRASRARARLQALAEGKKAAPHAGPAAAPKRAAPPRQVHLSTRVVELSDKEMADLGLSWNAARFEIKADAALLDRIRKKGVGRILNGVDLIARDGEEATSTSAQPGATSFTETNEGGNVARGVREADVEKELMVIPHVTGEDGKTILLTVIPKFGEKDGTQPFEEFNGGNLGTLKLPQTSQRIVVTKRVVPDGQTVIVHRRDEKTGVNRIYFITPRVIDFGKKSKPTNAPDKVALKIYDVAGLVHLIPDFPGPDFQLETGKTTPPGTSSKPVTAETLVHAIRRIGGEKSWAADKGASIEIHGNKLVVMQRPETHKAIEKLLAKYREAARQKKSAPQTQTKPKADPAAPRPGFPVFAPVTVGPFVLAAKDALSTFALDVDTASYAIFRRYVRAGYLPPPGAVRVEAFVNAFDYNYPTQTSRAFTAHVDAMPSPFRPGLMLLKVGVKGRVVGRDGRKPAHLILVVDTSGSMARADRLPLAKFCIETLAAQLRAGDRVTLISCGTSARLILDATPAGKRGLIERSARALQPAGSTNLHEGLVLAYSLARRAFRPGEINRVILLSDGVANIGPNDAETLTQTVSAARKQGITFTSVGFGLGSYNGAVLEALAHKGDGQYVFVDSRAEAKRLFQAGILGTLQTIAKDAKIQVAFNPHRVRRYRLLGYERRAIADKDFRNDTIDAGEVGSGQASTALYELELFAPVAGEAGDIGTVHVRYRDADTNKIQEIARRIEPSAVRRHAPTNHPRFFVAACAAELAEILRGSPYVAGSNLETIARVLEQAASRLPLDSQAKELLSLTIQAKGLPRAPYREVSPKK